MISESTMFALVSEWFTKMKTLILRDMSNYNTAGEVGDIERRDQFTAVLFKFLKSWMGYSYQQDGSFTHVGAVKALEEEGTPNKRGLTFEFSVHGRLDRLERGEVNFMWIWDTFLRDAVNEHWFIDKWKPTLGAGDFNVLQKGPPPSTSPRPYVGNRMSAESDNYANAIHEIISSRLSAQYKVEVRVS